MIINDGIDRLLKLESRQLIVFKNIYNDICVQYKDCEVKDGVCLISEYGCGKNIDQACYDYLNKISGRTLVFNAYGNNRKEVTVLF